MNATTQDQGRSRSALPIPLLLTLMLMLSACGGAGIEEGAYTMPGSGATYEFGANGQGRLLGAVAGTPTFTYEVTRDRVVVTYAGGLPEATFRRIDNKTLERQDGARLTLRE